MSPIVSTNYKEQKRQDILNAAMFCFTKKGFELSSIDDIRVQSGVSKGTIYNYFKSKDEIYLELINQKTAEYFKHISEGLSNYHTAIEKFDYLFSLYDTAFPLKEGEQREIIFTLEYKLRSIRHKKLNDQLTHLSQKYYHGLVIQIIEAGQQTNELKKNKSPEACAELFWIMLDGLLIQSVHQDYPYHAVLKEIQSMFYQRIKA
jgi:AcrR family transcriptional regulator